MSAAINATIVEVTLADGSEVEDVVISQLVNDDGDIDPQEISIRTPNGKAAITLYNALRDCGLDMK